MLAVLLACSSDPPPPLPGGEATTTPAEPAAPALPAEDVLPPDAALGVREVATPPTLLRLTAREDRVPPRHLELRVDFAHADYATVRARLQGWGFTVEDGDGASLRVVAPAGDRWAERLEPLRAVAPVDENHTQDLREGGEVRAGSATFGTVAYTWALREGRLEEKLEGAAVPPVPELPRSIPVAVVRCLAPIRTAMLDGQTAGVGWERALQTEPLAWAVVLENYGACEATGWLTMRADGVNKGLTVAGKPVNGLDDATLFAAATRYLAEERAASDEAAAAAVDILRRADDAALVAALTAITPGPHQERLMLAYAAKDEAAALRVAGGSTSSTLRGWAAGVDATARTEVLGDSSASAEALITALSAWRPASGDDPVLVRLRGHADSRVRMRAWELTLDSTLQGCLARAPSAPKATMEQAKALYAECPQQPVRRQSLGRVTALDRAAAATLVAGTLAAPETVVTGVNAARAANELELDELLVSTIGSDTGDRDVRAEALRLLLRAGRDARAAALVDRHGAFLGVKAMPAAAIAEGDEPQRKKRP
jgi:hypothetical protein